MSALITLSTHDAVVELSPHIGAAIASFRHAGIDVLRPTPPEAHEHRNVRQFACYPLVPYSNRIAQARLSTNGTDFALDRNFGDHPHAIHGVGWQREWTVETSDATSALLALDHSAKDKEACTWPFAFRATQAFVLSGDARRAMLSLTLAIENCDARPFPFGLGWHPFFPCDGTTELGFAANGVWHTDETRLPTRHEPLGSAQRFDPPRALHRTSLDNVFTGWEGAATIRWPAQRREARVEADACLAFLVVFVPDGRDCLAVEPVTHMTDGFNRAARGARDTGTLVLPPGRSHSCTMRIVSQPLP